MFHYFNCCKSRREEPQNDIESAVEVERERTCNERLRDFFATLEFMASYEFFTGHGLLADELYNNAPWRMLDEVKRAN